MIMPPSFPDPTGGDSGPGARASPQIPPKDESEIVLDLLRLMNHENGLNELIRDVMLLVRNWIGCEAVGIRLRDGEDFPYFETLGFPPEHVRLENRLCAVDQAGEIVRDSTGNPVLECMCGNVLTGRFDPSLPFFTESGSFWTNSTSELLASTSKEDRQARTRNRCHGEGYESVLLAPVRHGSRTLGLLQLNDSRKGFFSSELVQVLERLASNLGIGLIQREQAQRLRDREEELAAIYSHIPQATLLVDAERKVRSANTSAAAMAGDPKKELRGKRGGEALGCLHHLDDPRGCGFGPECERCTVRNSVLTTFRTGESFYQVEAELPVSQEGLRQSVTLLVSSRLVHIKGEPNVLVTLEDISDRKRTEEALRKREVHLQAILQATPDPLVVYDSIGHPQYINPSFSQVFGWNFQELQGQRIPFVPEDQKEITFNKIQEIYRTGVPVTFDTKRWTKDNRLLDIRVSAAIIRSSLEEHYGQVVILTDITERKQMEQRLEEMSIYDSLTGLYGRNFFEEEMTRLSDSRYSPLGIIVCDLDGLKFINDTLGHQAGDRMLKKTAEILRQNFRYSDIVARIGGDEFAVLLPQTGAETVECMLQRLRGALQEYNSSESELPLALSMGHTASETRADLQALFWEADNQMYREKIQQVGSTRSAILQTLTKTMQAKDFDTEGHCDRLQELAASLARSQGHSQEVINDLSLLARFHDLGKVGIPDSILFKQGALTEEEWQQMRQHCEIGHRTASSVPGLQPIADLILKHHERWDGQGYPLGLSGEDIPLQSRILAIVDAYDAMTRERPYRKAMSQKEAIAELRRCAGTQFDPYLVEKFIQALQEIDSE